LKKAGDMMTPEEFVRNGPNNPEDLIGKAKMVARVFCSKVRSGGKSPIRLLLYGPPGVGKSATCKIIAHSMIDHPVSLRRMSAKQVTTEQVRSWMQEIHYINNKWQVYWIEEIDAVTPDVEVLLLQFLDLLPDNNAVLVTSNEQMSGISSRFQSRCQAIRFDKPSIEEVEEFLRIRWPELGEEAREIAEANNGDVRASLNDAQGELDMRKYGKQ